jgi:hypothetical protein
VLKQVYRRIVLLILLTSAVQLTAVLTVRAQFDKSIRDKFVSEEYSVSWAKVRDFPKDVDLRIGYGSGHGGTLGWVWFRPSGPHIEVLSVGLDEGWNPYKSKWQPDIVPISVKRGILEPSKYAALLRQLAIVDSARLSRMPQNSASSTSANFWVAAEVARDESNLMSLDWAGYSGSFDEVEYTKPKIAVDLAKEAISKLDLVEHILNPGERGRISARFVEDWNKYRNRKFYWWVRERGIMIAGVLGDNASLPTLVEILSGKVKGDPGDRLIYYAINAVTRITGKDVRPKPVEEMDLEIAQKKVLELVGTLR